MDRFVDDRGYVQFIDENNDTVREHQLAAIAAGFDPKEVFDDEIHLHHLVDFPSTAGVKIDLPENICPIPAGVHIEIHNKGTPDTSIEAILNEKVETNPESG